MYRLVSIAAWLTISCAVALAQSVAPQAETSGQEPTEKVVTTAPGDLSGATLIGASVYNPGNEKIGVVDDVIISAHGNVSAVVIGVGGFLGISEKRVAMPFAALTSGRGDNNMLKFTVDGTKESLKAMPEFKYTGS